MAATRKAMAYSKRKVTAYTRKSKVKKLSYIKTVPPQKIVKFNMGNIRAFKDGKFKNVIKIVSAHDVQVRDLALEAVRQRFQGNLNKKLMDTYYFACRPFPHQILRDNKTFSGGTKGERIQTGMKHSFGSTTGRAAFVKRGKPIFEIYFLNKKDAAFIRNLAKSAVPKLPCKTKIVYEELKR